MSEPTVRYIDSSYYGFLCMDIAQLERHIHHDIDNYGMDMSPELKEALRELEKACRATKKRMEAERCIE